MTLGKLSSRRPVTTRPSSVGWNFPSSSRTYPRSLIVLTIDAYVDGRPIPLSSSSLIRELSEKRGGGWVKCWAPTSSPSASRSPSARGGRRFPSPFSSSASPSSPSLRPSGSPPASPAPPCLPLPSLPSWYTSRYPGNRPSRPEQVSFGGPSGRIAEDIDRGLLEFRRRHLGGHEPVPDEGIE